MFSNSVFLFLIALQLMAEKLLYAIFNCTEMDADFRTTESDVAGWGTAAASIPSDWQSTGSAEYN